MAFTVDTPTLNQLLPKGAAFDINWTDDSSNLPYTIELYKGGVFVVEINNTVGAFTYEWTPDSGRTTGQITL